MSQIADAHGDVAAAHLLFCEMCDKIVGDAWQVVFVVHCEKSK